VIAPALAAGNAVIVKASDLAPFAALRLANSASRRASPVCQCRARRSGSRRGARRHPGVSKIHFTVVPAPDGRSPERGRKALRLVWSSAGKSANLIFADVDLDFAARVALTAAIGLNGQVCTAGTRLLVEQGLPDLRREAHELMNKRGRGRPGRPTKRSARSSPSSAAERIVGVSTVRSTSDRPLVTGGTRLGGDLRDGFFIPPTLV